MNYDTYDSYDYGFITTKAKTPVAKAVPPRDARAARSQARARVLERAAARAAAAQRKGR